MSADAIADVVATYARPLGWDLAPHDLRRTFAKLARSGLAPLDNPDVMDYIAGPYPWKTGKRPQ